MSKLIRLKVLLLSAIALYSHGISADEKSDLVYLSNAFDKNTYTRELMEASGTFAINVPCQAQAEMVVKVGSSSGRELLEQGDADNKFAALGLSTFAASHIEVPLLEGCVAWLECRIIPEPHIQQAYDLFVAEVVAAYADSRVFSNGRWHFDGQDELRTLHHVAGGFFFTPSQSVTVQSA